MITKKYLDKLTYDVVGAAIEVHKALGAGLVESVYHECLKRELLLRKIAGITAEKNFLSDGNDRADSFQGNCFRNRLTL